MGDRFHELHGRIVRDLTPDECRSLLLWLVSAHRVSGADVAAAMRVRPRCRHGKHGEHVGDRHLPRNGGAGPFLRHVVL